MWYIQVNHRLKVMAEADKKWYVLRAVSGKEAKVKEYIEAQMKHEPLLSAHVYQVLIPMEKHASIRNGKRIVKEKVSMAGYVFVEASLVGDVAHMLRFVPNVLGFLGGMDKPTPVPMADINRMLGNAEETELVDDVIVPFVVAFPLFNVIVYTFAVALAVAVNIYDVGIGGVSVIVVSIGS